MLLELILGFLGAGILLAALFSRRLRRPLPPRRQAIASLLGLALIGISLWIYVVRRPAIVTGIFPTATAASSGHPPVIIDIQTSRNPTTFAGTLITAEVHFKDEDGDASQLAFALVQSTITGVALPPEPITIPLSDQQQGASLTVEWDCQGTAAMVLFKAVILDAAGLRSNLVPLLFDCG